MRFDQRVGITAETNMSTDRIGQSVLNLRRYRHPPYARYWDCRWSPAALAEETPTERSLRLGGGTARKRGMRGRSSGRACRMGRRGGSAVGSVHAGERLHVVLVDSIGPAIKLGDRGVIAWVWDGTYGHPPSLLHALPVGLDDLLCEACGMLYLLGSRLKPLTGPLSQHWRCCGRTCASEMREGNAVALVVATVVATRKRSRCTVEVQSSPLGEKQRAHLWWEICLISSGDLQVVLAELHRFFRR